MSEYNCEFQADVKFKASDLPVIQDILLERREDDITNVENAGFDYLLDKYNISPVDYMWPDFRWEIKDCELFIFAGEYAMDVDNAVRFGEAIVDLGITPEFTVTYVSFYSNGWNNIHGGVIKITPDEKREIDLYRYRQYGEVEIITERKEVECV